MKKKIKRELVSQDEYGKVMSAIVENAEQNLHLAELQGQIIDKLAYSFMKDGRAIRGLTYWGLLSCAEAPKDKKRKWSPVWTKPDFTPAGNLMIVTVGCTNPKSKHIEYGSCTFNPHDRFGERTALTNAKRYALDKHIGIAQKVAYVEYLVANKPKAVLNLTPPKSTAEKNKALNPTADPQKENAIKSLFSKINETGLPTDKVTAYFKGMYKVEHLRELTIENLRRCYTIVMGACKSAEAKSRLEEVIK